MNYEEMQQQMRLEIAERLTMFGKDVADWTAAPRTEAMGIASTQRIALVDMMQVLAERQELAFKTVDNRLPATTFADGSVDLLVEMAGAQELWRIFRGILSEHEDSGLKRAVKAGARIAGDCYAHCIRIARNWEIISPDRLREQPLVFLDAVDSPATASRDDESQALNGSIRRWRNMKLPLPIVLLPFDYAQCLWTFCGLHHEVGHNVDRDLGIISEIRGVLPDLITNDQEPHWRRWSGEILADAFGIVLGGAGFGASLGTLTLLLGPGVRYSTLDPKAVHPPFVLRCRLMIEMLRQTGVPGHSSLADQLRGVWEEVSKPDWMTPFAEKAETIAKLFLNTSLTTLANHRLVDMNPALALDHKRTEELASYLLNGSNRPVPLIDAGMHPRLVPCAAQLAVRNAIPADANLLRKIHDRAFDYLDLIPPIATLAAPIDGADERRQYWRKLAEDIDFRFLDVRKED